MGLVAKGEGCTCWDKHHNEPLPPAEVTLSLTHDGGPEPPHMMPVQDFHSFSTEGLPLKHSVPTEAIGKEEAQQGSMFPEIFPTPALGEFSKSQVQMSSRLNSGPQRVQTHLLLQCV